MILEMKSADEGFAKLNTHQAHRKDDVKYADPHELLYEVFLWSRLKPPTQLASTIGENAIVLVLTLQGYECSYAIDLVTLLSKSSCTSACSTTNCRDQQSNSS